MFQLDFSLNYLNSKKHHLSSTIEHPDLKPHKHKPGIRSKTYRLGQLKIRGIEQSCESRLGHQPNMIAISPEINYRQLLCWFKARVILKVYSETQNGRDQLYFWSEFYQLNAA